MKNTYNKSSYIKKKNNNRKNIYDPMDNLELLDFIIIVIIYAYVEKYIYRVENLKIYDIEYLPFSKDYIIKNKLYEADGRMENNTWDENRGKKRKRNNSINEYNNNRNNRYMSLRKSMHMGGGLHDLFKSHTRQFTTGTMNTRKRATTMKKTRPPHPTYNAIHVYNTGITNAQYKNDIFIKLNTIFTFSDMKTIDDTISKMVLHVILNTIEKKDKKLYCKNNQTEFNKYILTKIHNVDFKTGFREAIDAIYNCIDARIDECENRKLMFMKLDQAHISSINIYIRILIYLIYIFHLITIKKYKFKDVNIITTYDIHTIIILTAITEDNQEYKIENELNNYTINKCLAYFEKSHIIKYVMPDNSDYYKQLYIWYNKTYN